MKYLFVSLFLSFYAAEAFPWGSMGHQSSGEIAERFLAPHTRAGLIDLLGPDKIASFSTWADNVRNDPDFDPLKEYHFISGKNDAEKALRALPLLINARESERSVKIAALKFLIHIVQDVHQPLHAGIRNDVGGNFCNVEWLPGVIMNLHEIWDGKIIDFDIARLRKNPSPFKSFTYINYADAIIATTPLTIDEIGRIEKTPFAEWIKESQELEKNVYPEEGSEYCKKGASIFPKISEEYKAASAIIVQRRILHSGIRLAGLLNQIFKDQPTSLLDKKQIIEKLRATSGTQLQEL